MKKIVALIMVIILMAFPTPVRAENLTIDDVFSEIQEEDWDQVVNFFKNAQIEDVRSGDITTEHQLRVLINALERRRNNPYHGIIHVSCGIGIWEKDLKEKEKTEKMLDNIRDIFQAKCGAKLRIVKTKEKPEDGYSFYMFLSDVPEYWLHQVTKVGEEASVQVNYNDGRYFESAWGDGSGRNGVVGNKYISSGDRVTIVKVAYLDENNEVVEVVSENDVEIEGYRRRMLLVKKGETILGWFHPENILTE